MNLENLSLEVLLNALHPSFYISRTFFSNISKRYIISHIYSVVQEYNEPYINTDNWDTAGLVIDNIEDISITVYGGTARETLVRFYRNYPKYYVSNSYTIS